MPVKYIDLNNPGRDATERQGVLNVQPVKNILGLAEQKYSRAPNCVRFTRWGGGGFFTREAGKTLAFLCLMVFWHLVFCMKPICSCDRARACAVSARLPNRLGSSCKRLISFFLLRRS